MQQQLIDMTTQIQQLRVQEQQLRAMSGGSVRPPSTEKPRSLSPRSRSAQSRGKRCV